VVSSFKVFQPEFSMHFSYLGAYKIHKYLDDADELTYIKWCNRGYIIGRGSRYEDICIEMRRQVFEGLILHLGGWHWYIPLESQYKINKLN